MLTRLLFASLLSFSLYLAPHAQAGESAVNIITQFQDTGVSAVAKDGIRSLLLQRSDLAIGCSQAMDDFLKAESTNLLHWYLFFSGANYRSVFGEILEKTRDGDKPVTCKALREILQADIALAFSAPWLEKGNWETFHQLIETQGRSLNVEKQRDQDKYFTKLRAFSDFLQFLVKRRTISNYDPRLTDMRMRAIRAYGKILSESAAKDAKLTKKQRRWLKDQIKFIGTLLAGCELALTK